MRRRLARTAPIDEGEGYYASMTDMMIGVIFIFIILMAFLGLNYRGAVQRLTGARDAETTALLGEARNLQPLAIAARVDRDRRVLCVPTTALAGAPLNVTEGAERCFAYGQVRSATDAPDPVLLAAVQARSLIERMRTELAQAEAPVSAAGAAADQTLAFDADVLFAAGGATLTPRGQQAAADVARILDPLLPCMGYQRPAANCEGIPKRSRVSVTTAVSTDAFTVEGRAALTLAFERSAAFHRAVVAARPDLLRVRNGPFGTTEPLLQVAAFGRSQQAANEANTLAIEFVPQ